MCTQGSLIWGYVESQLGRSSRQPSFSAASDKLRMGVGLINEGLDSVQQAVTVPDLYQTPCSPI